MKKILAISIAAALFTGCASTEKDTYTKLETNLKAGNTIQAIELAKERAGFDEKEKTIDDQLWGMQTASLYRMNGQYQQSNHYFDLIEDVMYQEDTENLVIEGSETIGSIITNDTFLDYEQSMFDSIMVNTYKALNFTAQGDFTNARVEWNRSDDRQRRAANYFADKINEAKEETIKKAKKDLAEEGQTDTTNAKKSFTESQKLLSEQGIDMSQWHGYEGYINPFSTYMHGLFFMLTAQDKSDINKAVDSLKRVSAMTETNVAAESLKIAKSLQSGAKQASQLSKVWVIFENGQAAKKEEFQIHLPLFIFSDNVSYTGIALPKLKENDDHFQSLTVQGINTEVIADMDRIVKAEFKEEFPMILAREITRATVKTIAQKQVHDKNQYLGYAMALAQAATTSADLRTWSMLPKNFQAAVLDKPQSGQLTIESVGMTKPLTIDVSADKNTIVYVKAISPLVPPTIEVFTL